jgi:hypothetical protein
LAEAVTHQVAAGRHNHMVGQLGGTTSTALAFLFSCRHVSTNPRAKSTKDLAGRLVPRPIRPGVWSTWSTCQIHPQGDDDFDIWSTSLCHPMKCSNLVPKFLKSNKH